MMRPLLLVAVLLTLSVPGPAVADEDHIRARAALEAGQILPLETIVAAARAHTGAAVLDVELEEAHGDNRHRRYGRDGAAPSFIYEVKLLAADGRIIKLDYDAETGALLRDRRRH